MARNPIRERRVAVVDAYPMSAGAFRRFQDRYPDLTAPGVRAAEAAVRQWFRLVARRPRADLTMPSTVADRLWAELIVDAAPYAALCGAAFGRHLDRTEAESAARPAALGTTLRLARADERCRPPDLPLLFRLDGSLGVPGGRRYLADCGGRAECHQLPGAVCLVHLPVRAEWWRRRPRPRTGSLDVTSRPWGGAATG